MRLQLLGDHAMAYSAYAVANAFVKKATDGELSGLSPMKLQKLMYFAQAWHLKVKDKPLLDDQFARWQHGPVIPSIYHEFKAFGWSSITRQATTLSVGADGGYEMNIPIIPPEDKSTWGLIDAIIKKYGHLNATALSELTHKPGSAWDKGGGGDGSVIKYEDIAADTALA